MDSGIILDRISRHEEQGRIGVRLRDGNANGDTGH